MRKRATNQSGRSDVVLSGSGGDAGDYSHFSKQEQLHR
jgi:hypothetical protein